MVCKHKSNFKEKISTRVDQKQIKSLSKEYMNENMIVILTNVQHPVNYHGIRACILWFVYKIVENNWGR